MRELIPTIQSWLSHGKQMALATVIEVQGSSPRPQGAKMLVSSNSEMVGSVSGGCVEGNVVEEALQCLQNSQPRLLEYGIDNSSPWSVGLACGGQIKVFIEPVFPAALPNGFNFIFFSRLIELINTGQPFLIASIIDGEKTGEKGLYSSQGWVFGDAEEGWVNKISPHLEHLMKNETSNSELVEIDLSQAQKIFLEKVLPPARLVIVGAVHIAASLVNIARELGYQTIVIDPRSAFLTRERFPSASDLVHAWPQEALEKMNLKHTDCLVSLSHDQKIDVPALSYALKSEVGYIGLLGSIKTRKERFNALREEGITNHALERIHAPVGLDIGAVNPEEIAISIMAEIIASQRKEKKKI